MTSLKELYGRIDFPEDHIFECAKQGPIILVVAAISVKSTYGKAMLSGISATKFYIKSELPEVEAFISSLPDSPVQLRIDRKNLEPPVDPETEKNENRKCIAEWLQLDFHTDKNNKYTCEAVIKEIISHDGWWYRACPRCKSGMQTYDQNIYCKKCGSLDDVLIAWYRLTVAVEDHTGIIPFILFGQLALELISLPATTLSTMAKDRYEVPPFMNKICGQKKVFQIRMSDRIQNSSQMAFKVTHVFKEMQVIKVETLSPPTSQTSQLLTRNSPFSVSTSKPRRMLQLDESSSSSSSQDVKKAKLD
ncbi:replication protein A 70 kDa DNA-binding subunit A-like [Mercurialis annua]|uniref:replication protein A 70 kDa DNA-binding subunit A-like n=1 Tax=Mercurialis annua TaxID=3986 RepID=UPI0024ADA77B|nr:replication protein A 70 kDa DNA-binding subunit A-like [Mercurialis annua]